MLLRLFFFCCFFASFLSLSGQASIQSNFDSAHIYFDEKNFDRSIFLLEENLVSCDDITLDSSCTFSRELYSRILYRYGYTAEADSLADLVIRELEKQNLIQGESMGSVLNTKGSLCLAANEPDKALEYYQRSMQIRESLYGKQSYEVSSSMMNISLVYRAKNELPKAREILEEVIAFRENEESIDKTKLLTPLNNLGVVLNSMCNYRAAEAVYRKALRIMEVTNTEKGNGNIYQGLGNVYQNFGDYNQSIIYFKKANSSYLEDFGPQYRYIPGNNYNIGSTYKQLGNFEKALEYGHRACNEYLKKYDEWYYAVVDVHELLGISYANLGRLDSAEYYMRKAIANTSKTKGNEYLTADLYTSYGDYYRIIGELDSAEWGYQESIRIYENLVTKQEGLEDYISDSYFVYADFLIDKGDIESATRFYQKSLEWLKWKEEHNEIDFGKHHSPRLLLEPLQGLSEAYFILHQQTKDANWWSKSNAIIQILDQLVDHLRVDFQQSGTDFLILEKARKTYELAVRLHLSDLGEKEQAFVFAEKAKSIRLLSAFHRNRTANYANVPDSLLVKEEYLRTEVGYLQNRNATDSYERAAEIFEKRTALDTLMKCFEKEYPEFYQARFKTSVLSLEETQKLLDDSTTLVEYVMTDSTIFIFSISKDEYQVKESVIDSTFSAQLKTLIRLSSKYTGMNAKEFCRLSSGIYKLLLSPLSTQIKSTNRLIIVPDGILSYLPFELLLTEYPEHQAREYARHAYLVKQFQISYCNSATLLKEMRTKEHRSHSQKGILGFAPFYFGNPSSIQTIKPLPVDSFAPSIVTDFKKPKTIKIGEWHSLEASGLEIQAVHNMLDGEVLFGFSASLVKFKELAPKYRILLLPTHGKANDEIGERSFLVFTHSETDSLFEKLTVKDLYSIPLSADMVVLSACETGVGEWQRGEGMISLSRAFSFAGAKSVVNTLWQVNDERTALIMVTFFDLLKRGLSKDHALQVAKLAYLKLFPKHAHPSYWAGSIAVGDMSKLVLDD